MQTNRLLVWWLLIGTLEVGSSASEGVCPSDVGPGEAPVRLSVDSVFLQSQGSRDALRVAASPGEGVGQLLSPEFLQEPGAPLQGLPLCHSLVVSKTCQSLNGGPAEGAPATVVTTALLADQLSAETSDISAVWAALGLPASQAEVECQELCERAVKYVGSVGGVLPTATDVACYTVRGKTTCDVDVAPNRLVEKLALVGDEQVPDRGPNVVPVGEGPTAGQKEPVLQAVQFSVAAGAAGKLGLRRGTGGGGSPGHSRSGGGVPDACPYTLWEGAERLLGFFRIYPSNGRSSVRLSLPRRAQGSGVGGPVAGLVEADAEFEGQAPQEVETKIAATNVQAKAWVSTALREMRSWKAAEFRQRWFGGAGSMRTEDVRARVMRTMNFVERELVDGMHFVYPADQAVFTICGGDVVAYVWKGGDTVDVGYAETTNPVCQSTEDPFAKRCGLDQDGRYYVYLCRKWYDGVGDNFQIATFVHEASHHAGPGDVKYKREEIVRLSQADQLNNAASYHNFAQDVAQSAWGCKDVEAVTGTGYTCGNGQLCTCPSMAGLCGKGGDIGRKVLQQCKTTCGLCQAPPPCEDADGNCEYYRQENYCQSSENVRSQCRRSCGICRGEEATAQPTQVPTPAPTELPRECVDRDGNCEFYKNKGYCATSVNVQKYCTKSCGLCCEDEDGVCAYYKKEGYCTSSQNVQRLCKKSCGLCR